MSRRTGSEYYRMPIIDIVCGPCRRSGKHRRLARFDLGPDGPAVTAWIGEGLGAAAARPHPDSPPEARRIRPQWTTGPDGAEKIHLRCGCGHTPQIRRERIEEALAAAPPGVTTVPL